MRELDEKKLLNGDVIDGIMMEDKKEVDKVILTGAELSKYFGKETTPREMKDQIIKLLDDWKGQQKEHEKPEKKTEQEMTVARLVCGINRLAQMKHLQSLVFAHGFGHKKRAPIHPQCGANRRSMYITIFNFICYNCMVFKTSAFFD